MTAPDRPSPDPRRLADACTDLARTTLAGLPDRFQQLVYLASLRDIATDAYTHWGLEQTYGAALAQQALAQSHREAFRDVFRLPLAELAEQIGRFLAGRPDGGRTLLANWQRDFSYNLLAPTAVDPLERENFRIHFEAVMAALAAKARD